MQATTRQLVTGAEKGALVGAAMVVLLGAVVTAVAMLGAGTVDLLLVRAEWADRGREFALDLRVSALLWAVPVLGGLLGAAVVAGRRRPAVA